jgi:glycosyltransferase involved in cell wall biosynthesis
MKIAIDISQIVYGTGVSVYTKELVNHLLKIDSNNKYLLFAGSLRQRQAIRNFSSKTKIYPIPPTLADFLWNRLHILSVETLLGSIDVFHSSDWTQPPSRAFKVTTVHDLVPIKLPQETHPKIVKTHKARLGLIKEEVDRIIVPSNSTKNDLLGYGFNENKIIVIPEADNLGPKPQKDEIDHVLGKYNIVSPFVLTVGTSPRKNISRLTSAFNSFNKKQEMQLVVVGGDPQKSSENVIYTGFISDGELTCLYYAASIFAYPSLYEGFGLPILNAFAASCPVVASNTSSIPEVAGTAAILVDPLSVGSIADGLSQALKKRDFLVKSGLKQVKKFSWDNTARLTLNVYKESQK